MTSVIPGMSSKHLLGSLLLRGSYSALTRTGLTANFTVLPQQAPSSEFPSDLRQEILGVASSHLICSVALTGVLALQAGRWWAERGEDDEAQDNR